MSIKIAITIAPILLPPSLLSFDALFTTGDGSGAGAGVALGAGATDG